MVLLLLIEDIFMIEGYSDSPSLEDIRAAAAAAAAAAVAAAAAAARRRRRRRITLSIATKMTVKEKKTKTSEK